MTLGGGRPGSGSKLGHYTRIEEKVWGDVRVSHLCAGEVDGVGIARVYNVKFSPEHAVDDGTIFHTCHINVVGGRNCGFKRDLLSRDEFEVERSRHFCDWRGTGGARYRYVVRPWWTRYLRGWAAEASARGRGGKERTHGGSSGGGGASLTISTRRP